VLIDARLKVWGLFVGEVRRLELADVEFKIAKHYTNA